MTGVDLSKPSVQIAWENASHLSNIIFVHGNAYDLPLPYFCFDIAISRTAPYSTISVYHLLKERGCFLAYIQGPMDYSEIAKAFNNRYTIEKPQWLKKIENWINIERHKKAGFGEVKINNMIKNRIQ